MLLSRGRAEEQLQARQKFNRNRTRMNNAELPANCPKFFYCLSCDTEIIVPDSFLPSQKLCPACKDMEDEGWL